MRYDDDYAAASDKLGRSRPEAEERSERAGGEDAVGRVLAAMLDAPSQTPYVW